MSRVRYGYDHTGMFTKQFEGDATPKLREAGPWEESVVSLADRMNDDAFLAKLDRNERQSATVRERQFENLEYEIASESFLLQTEDL